MEKGGLLAQLNQRRVIRAALLYVALAWLALQAADLLAGAEIISDRLVRWLILIAAIGFPVTVLASWFLDSPWRDRKWLAVAGDVVIIAAIGIAAALFAWQQWFVSFTRPLLVVDGFVATDTREDSQSVADRIARTHRVLLAMRPELRVVEFGSHFENTRYRVAGTLAQGASTVRITIQLFESGDELVWIDSFEGRLTDEQRLLERMHAGLLMHLPVPEAAVSEARKLVASCKSPAERDALLLQARQRFNQLPTLPTPRQSVMQQLAMQHLRDADTLCPGWPDTELLRLENTLELEQVDIDEHSLLRRFPNSAFIRHRIADRRDRAGDKDAAEALHAEACLLQPESPRCG